MAPSILLCYGLLAFHMSGSQGRKEVLLMRATTKIDWYVNVWSEQISGPRSIKASNDVLANKGLIICPYKLGHDA